MRLALKRGEQEEMGINWKLYLATPLAGDDGEQKVKVYRRREFGAAEVADRLRTKGHWSWAAAPTICRIHSTQDPAYEHPPKVTQK